MGIEGFHSVMGRNLRLMQSKFKMDESNVLKSLNHKCDNESDAVRLSVQVREICGWRYKCNCTFLVQNYHWHFMYWLNFNCLLLF